MFFCKRQGARSGDLVLGKQSPGVRPAAGEFHADAGDADGFVFALSLDSHDIASGLHRFEDPIAVGVGASGFLAGVELAVIVGVEPDRKTRDPCFAAVEFVVAVLVAEDSAAQQCRCRQTKIIQVTIMTGILPARIPGNKITDIISMIKLIP